MRLQTGPLDALSEATFFAFTVQALHPVLDLIDRLFLAVEALNSNQVEHISCQVALNRHIKWRLGGK